MQSLNYTLQSINRMRRIICFLFLIVLMVGCSKDEVTPEGETAPEVDTSGAILFTASRPSSYITRSMIENVEALVFVGGKHRQRLEVNVAHYAPLSHTVVELVAELGVLAEEAHKVEVAVAAVILACVLEKLQIEVLERFVVALDQLVTAVEHLLVTRELSESDCRENVGHITPTSYSQEASFSLEKASLV